LPDELLEKAERIAEQKHTTVSALLRDLLIDLTSGSEIDEIKKRLDTLEKEVFRKKK
jgi:predicted transcriptional regulator